ncbi:hypothetical protein KQ300_06265 [Synechococcus sp. CS-1331]|uniref:hypothetical protein n=1 Tax=Synechococcus sp. CS-1331 TaxID=2847973 RepID=UPI0019A6BE99|nr:hypothetical protein [Synechococcus sp. CS-1331]MCT0227793.1 hypothetical protein [Synechococcus sp. CS-1331]NQW39536.1 hypothetical protein [Cyanobacteria bacterium bin.275]
MPSPIPPSSSPASESLVASLCREAERLRCRARQVVADIGRCREEGLVRRLQQELQLLQGRRLELQASAKQLSRTRAVRDNLAVAFLDELTRRPLAC